MAFEPQHAKQLLSSGILPSAPKMPFDGEMKAYRSAFFASVER